MYCDDSSFTVKVDVRDFNPGDLTVKVTGDFVEVQGKHEEKKVRYPGKNILWNSYFVYKRASIRCALCLNLCSSVFCQKGGPGLTTRQFNRRYRIPKGVHTMALESAMSPEGVLIISAPMLQTENSGILP